MTTLPRAALERVLRRVGHIWGPDAAPHHLIYGQTGSGKTTLIKALLSLCEHERVLILDPKPHADPVWDGPPGDPHRWGKPVTGIGPRFGYEGDPGGGPYRLRYRLLGSPDRAETRRRFAAALETVAAEGHAVLVLDDVRETCRQLKLGEHVDSILNLGRSANVLAILAATETGYVSGRAQAAITWVGSTTGLDAAKAAAGLLGWRGRERQDLCAAIEPRQWIYADTQPGSAGPVLTALRAWCESDGLECWRAPRDIGTIPLGRQICTGTPRRGNLAASRSRFAFPSAVPHTPAASSKPSDTGSRHRPVNKPSARSWCRSKSVNVAKIRPHAPQPHWPPRGGCLLSRCWHSAQ